MGKFVTLIVLVLLLAGPVLCAEGEAPWWKEQKIRFMWGTWPPAQRDFKGSLYYWTSDHSREFFRNIAQSGATVFAEVRGYKPKHARFAHEFGLKYFATLYPGYLYFGHGHGVHLANGRRRVTETGEQMAEESGRFITCPLDESIHEKWLLVGAAQDVPLLKGVQDGLIDGIHTDWEVSSHGICYCDDCFSTFPERQGITEALPGKRERFRWLKKHDLVDVYKEDFSQRRIGMYAGIREKLHAVKPDLLFSAYGTTFSDFTRAMNTPETPFIFLDPRHYYNDDRQPWWESYSARLRREGYLYIAGAWTNAIFGAQPSQVSAAQWIYEASINEDGCWLWFEHEVTDDMLRAYSAADRKLRAVQDKVGKYLFYGERDATFVTAVEWTGRPDLERAVNGQTYHLDGEHLSHINNVNTEWPLRARIRFPRLAADKQWTVHDPMSGQYYTRDGKSAVWTTADLLAGVVVAMEARTDLFLLVTPVDGEPAIGSSRLMYSREFDVLSGHEVAAAEAGPVKGNPFRLPRGGWHLKMDEEDVGVKMKWFLPDASLDGWVPIEIETFWGNKGGLGAGWYRGDVNIPSLPENKHIYLHFGAVDEELELWIDGEHAGNHNIGPDGWDKPFAIDVTGKLTVGKHHLAMRVYNSAQAGGIWKPVSILAGPNLENATRLTHVPSSGRSGRLVYTATEPMALWQSTGGLVAGNAIRTANDDGANEVRVRQLHGHLWSPSYSPDGQRIAFVHDASGRGQVCVINADGSDPANISSNDFCDRSPAWAPDGKRIVFLSDRTGDWDVYVMNADGSDQRRLAGNPGLDRAPAWAPDGTRIAWESHTSGAPTIWISDTNGRNSRPLVPTDQHVKVQDMQTGQDGVFHFENVESVFPDNPFYLTNPVWSPDGTRIAAVKVGDDSGSTVAVLDADGSRMLRVIRWTSGPDNLTWSPDGTQLAGTLRTAPQETERSGIFVVKADGTEDHRLLIDVTPQGPRLGGARRRGLLTWYSHGSAQPRRVLKTFASLAWSPDGQTLAFSSDMDVTGAFHVYTIQPEGGKPTRLDGTRSAWINEIMWRPEQSR